jgi:hypothetical protein
MNRITSAIAFVLVLAFAGATPAGQAQGPPPADAWRAFEGTWSAAGQRQTLPTEGAQPAAIVRLSGAVVLTSGAGLSRGFRGEAIAFDDGRSVSAGRSVWTDERGDRIFIELKGEPYRTGRRIVGTITGGTGRYAGMTGDLSFAWQYIIAGDAGEVQGLTVGLKGRFRTAEALR